MALSKRSSLIDTMRAGLIISVQEDAGSPLDHPEIIAALVQVVSIPGCVGLRLNEPKNIRAARGRTSLPILGIYKTYLENGRVLITPTFEMAKALADAGADIIALDATDYPRLPGQSVPELIARIHDETDRPVMADISSFEEGIAAFQAGADLIATTLSGYIRPPFTHPYDPPDLELVRRLSGAVSVPVIAEGRFNTPELAGQAIRAGAHAVVVGSAITRPDFVTNMFVQHLLHL
jgi:N-acylglucosamine-6-phosphate 2-epimerase